MLLKATIVSPGPLALGRRRRRVLPGTLYTFGPAGMPGVTANLRRTGLGVFFDGTAQRYGDHNLLLQSVDLTTASWSKNSLGSGTRVADPSGALKATQYTGTGTDGYASQAISVAAGQTYSYRVRLRTPSGTASLQCYFLGAGISAGTSLTVTTSWQTVTLSGTATSSGSTFFQIGGGSSWGTGKVIEIAEPQACAGPLTAHVDTTTAAVYLPRSPTYSSAGVLLGLLSEPAATNLLNTWSDFTTGAGWTVSSLTTAASVIPGPSGAIEGTTISAGTNTSQGVYKSFTVSASTVYTLSMRVKLGTMAANEFMFALYDNSNAGFIASDIVPTQTLTADAWVRVIYTFTTPAGCTSLRVYPFRRSAALASTKTVHVSNGQLELGSVATSDIPNPGGSTVVRTADDFTISGADFVEMFYDLGSNLVVNGDGNSTSGWSTLNSAAFTVTGGRMRVTSSGTIDPFIRQDVPTEIGKRYKVTASVFAGTSTGRTLVTEDFNTFAYTPAGQTAPVSFVFTARYQATPIFLGLADAGGATSGVWAEFDNVQVQEVLNDRGAELMPDGTFSSGIAGFVGEANGVVSHVGGRLRVTNTGGTNGRGYIDLATVVGRTYTVSFNLSAKTSGFGSCLIRSAGSYGPILAQTGDQSALARYTLTFTATLTSHSVAFYAVGADGTYAEFDNVSVREVLFEGTLAAEFQVTAFSTTSTFPGVFQFRLDTGGRFGAFMTMPGAEIFGLTNRGSDDYSALGPINTGRNRIVARWSASGVSYSLNGGPIVTSAGAPPLVDSFRIGRYDVHLGGTIPNIRVVKRAVSDAEQRELGKL